MNIAISTQAPRAGTNKVPVAAIASLVLACAGLAFFFAGACHRSDSLACSIQSLLAFGYFELAALLSFVAAWLAAFRGERRMLVIAAFLFSTPMLVFIGYLLSQ
jgi:hypothetical protein